MTLSLLGPHWLVEVVNMSNISKQHALAKQAIINSIAHEVASRMGAFDADGLVNLAIADEIIRESGAIDTSALEAIQLLKRLREM